MSIVVSDTTPLNYLILIGHVEVIRTIFGKLLIPPAVLDEMQHSRTPQVVSDWARNLPAWAEVVPPRFDLGLRIGRGEDEAISLAVELAGTPLLVDDRKAKIAADKRGVLTVGTLTVLDLADELGLLDFSDAITRLLATSFRIEDAVIQQLRDKIRVRKGK